MSEDVQHPHFYYGQVQHRTKIRNRAGDVIAYGIQFETQNLADEAIKLDVRFQSDASAIWHINTFNCLKLKEFYTIQTKEGENVFDKEGKLKCLVFRKGIVFWLGSRKGPKFELGARKEVYPEGFAPGTAAAAAPTVPSPQKRNEARFSTPGTRPSSVTRPSATRPAPSPALSYTPLSELGEPAENLNICGVCVVHKDKRISENSRAIEKDWTVTYKIYDETVTRPTLAVLFQKTQKDLPDAVNGDIIFLHGLRFEVGKLRLFCVGMRGKHSSIVVKSADIDAEKRTIRHLEDYKRGGLTDWMIAKAIELKEHWSRHGEGGAMPDVGTASGTPRWVPSSTEKDTVVKATKDFELTMKKRKIKKMPLDSVRRKGKHVAKKRNTDEDSASGNSSDVADPYFGRSIVNIKTRPDIESDVMTEEESDSAESEYQSVGDGGKRKRRSSFFQDPIFERVGEAQPLVAAPACSLLSRIGSTFFGPRSKNTNAESIPARVNDEVDSDSSVVFIEDESDDSSGDSFKSAPNGSIKTPQRPLVKTEDIETPVGAWKYDKSVFADASTIDETHWEPPPVPSSGGFTYPEPALPLARRVDMTMIADTDSEGGQRSEASIEEGEISSSDDDVVTYDTDGQMNGKSGQTNGGGHHMNGSHLHVDSHPQEDDRMDVDSPTEILPDPEPMFTAETDVMRIDSVTPPPPENWATAKAFWSTEKKPVWGGDSRTPTPPPERMAAEFERRSQTPHFPNHFAPHNVVPSPSMNIFSSGKSSLFVPSPQEKIRRVSAPQPVSAFAPLPKPRPSSVVQSIIGDTSKSEANDGMRALSKLRLLNELQPNVFCDIIVELRHLYKHPSREVTEMFVSDFTSNDLFSGEYLYDREPSTVFQISVFNEANRQTEKLLREGNAEPGTILYLRNVRPKIDYQGYLAGTLFPHNMTRIVVIEPTDVSKLTHIERLHYKQLVAKLQANPSGNANGRPAPVEESSDENEGVDLNDALPPSAVVAIAPNHARARQTGTLDASLVSKKYRWKNTSVMPSWAEADIPMPGFYQLSARIVNLYPTKYTDWVISRCEPCGQMYSASGALDMTGLSQLEEPRYKKTCPSCHEPLMFKYAVNFCLQLNSPSFSSAPPRFIKASIDDAVIQWMLPGLKSAAVASDREFNMLETAFGKLLGPLPAALATTAPEHLTHADFGSFFNCVVYKFASSTGAWKYRLVEIDFDS